MDQTSRLPDRRPRLIGKSASSSLHGFLLPLGLLSLFLVFNKASPWQTGRLRERIRVTDCSPTGCYTTHLWGTAEAEVFENYEDIDSSSQEGDEVANFGSVDVDVLDGSNSLQGISHQLQHMQQQLSMQQHQIDQMLQVLVPGKAIGSQTDNLPTGSRQNQNLVTPASQSSATGATSMPLRVMVFIDGTWLYYSLFERGDICPIAKRYGSGWYRQYRIDWEALPRIICQALQDPWSSGGQQRSVEITRMSVFTSYKAGTPETSLRYRLFQELRAVGYDVHQMETVGPSEKCVDIQLAVEMVHFATVPNSYDVAVLLSGDKDFLPALIRVRQKGRKVAIVSMMSGVNRALYQTDGVKDYDMVLLEDYLDELLIPIDPSNPMEGQTIHPFILNRVIWEFLKASGRPAVSSRDVGRFLKSLVYKDSTLLDEIKGGYSSLRAFIKESDLFTMEFLNPESPVLGDNHAFKISLYDEDSGASIIGEQMTKLNEAQRKTLASYLQLIPQDKQTAYYFTYQGAGRESKREFVPGTELVEVPPELREDYSTYTVPRLKERCRERGLPTNGLKADLLERVQKDAEEQIKSFQDTSRSHRAGYRKYFVDLVQEYLHASGGSASSRDIGRYLAVNKFQFPGSPEKMSANVAMKKMFGGLTAFVLEHENLFEIDFDFVDGEGREGKYAFRVSLKA